MIKLFYYIRVFFISFEFLLISIAFLLYVLWGDSIKYFFDNQNINKEAVKWITLVPFAIFIWMLKNGMDVIFPSDDERRSIQKWDKYWKLKAHFNIGLLYALMSNLSIILLWMADHLDKGLGAILFFLSITVISVSAFSFYMGKIKIREIIVITFD